MESGGGRRLHGAASERPCRSNYDKCSRSGRRTDPQIPTIVRGCKPWTPPPVPTSPAGKSLAAVPRRAPPAARSSDLVVNELVGLFTRFEDPASTAAYNLDPVALCESVLVMDADYLGRPQAGRAAGQAP